MKDDILSHELEALEMMVKDMIRNEQDISPMFVLFTNEKQIIIMSGWADEYEKKVIMNKVAEIAKLHQATAYSFLTEIWYVSKTIGEEIKVQPSKDPSRKEAVMICVKKALEKEIVKIYDIDRKEKVIIESESFEEGAIENYLLSDLQNIISDNEVLKN